MPDTAVKTAIKIKKPINFEAIADYIFYCLVFLLPIFVLPLTINALAFSKAIVFYAGASVAFLLWLFSRLQKGDLKIPKSGLLLALSGIVLVFLAASVFSVNFRLSFFGSGYDTGTFFFVLFGLMAAFLMSVFFQSEKKLVIFYSLLLASAIIVFIFQAIQISPVGPVGKIIKFGQIGQMFPFKISNLVGGWNDLAIFFGFIALSSLVFFELLYLEKRLRVALFALLALSLIAMLAVNFSIAWHIFGALALVFLVYNFSRPSFESKTAADAGSDYAGRKLIGLSLIVVLLVFFAILGRGFLANLTTFLGTNTIDVRPSWSATYEVSFDALKTRPVLGSGPNTFLYDWLKHKPAAINSTIFWNTRFQSGIGYLPSVPATAGILGGAAVLVFLAFLVYYGLKVISYSKNDINRPLLVASYLGAVYLWLFAIFYSPGILIMILAFIMTGALVAVLARAEKIKNAEITFVKNPKLGFVSVLLIVFLMIADIFILYSFAQKYWSAYSYAKGVNALNIEGDLDKAEAGVARAAQFDRQDLYFRSLSDIAVLRMGQVLNQQNVSQDILRNQFQNALGAAIQNAQAAIDLNPQDPLNWMTLGGVYAAVIPLNISGAKDFAIGSYSKAREVSPSDPSPYLAMARAEALGGDTKQARNYIDAALGIKPDFAGALFYLSQIEAQEGNLAAAIQMTEQAVMAAPNDLGALFQLGLLYYQNDNYDGAKFALERAVGLDPNYSNARYFLGLIYDREGRKNNAIEQFEKINELNPGNAEVARILNNLRAGRQALTDISPPQPPPEERKKPPVE